MPSVYFLRPRGSVRNEIQRTELGLQDSLEVLVGKGKLLFRSYRFIHSSKFSGFAESQGLLRDGTVLAASSDCPRSISVVGALSRTIYAPSVSGPAFQFCGYHIDRALVDSSPLPPPVSKFRSNSMAASASASGLVIGGYLVDTLKHGHLSSSTSSGDIFSGTRSLNSCIKPRMSLKNQEKPINLPIYRHFLYTAGKRWLTLIRP